MKIQYFLTFVLGVAAGSCGVLAEQTGDWRLTAGCCVASFVAGLIVWEKS